MTRGAQAARMGAGVFMLMHAIEGCLGDSPSSIEARDGVALQPGSL